MRKFNLVTLLLTAVIWIPGCSVQKDAEERADVESVQSNEKQTAEEKDNSKEEEKEMYTVESGYAMAKADVEYGERVEITYESATTGTARKANIILPAGYSEEKEYPILYLLHGIGGDQNEWISGNPEIIVGNLIAKGEAEEMIIVIPNVRARANDSANPADIYTVEHFKAFDNFINDLKNDLMPYIEANYSIAAGRENTAVAGLSMGGREALYIGLSMPDTFGYVGAFCPAPGVLPYNVESGLFQTDEFKLAEGYESLIMIAAGSTDTVVGSWPETYSKTLTSNGTEHIYYVAEGGHDFTVWKNGLYNFSKLIFKD